MSGMTRSVQAPQTRNSARSSSDWIASTEPELIARRIACELPPRPAWASLTAPSVVPRAATETSASSFDVVRMFVVSRRELVLTGLCQVLPEEELATHVDIEDEQVHLICRQRRNAGVR